MNSADDAQAAQAALMLRVTRLDAEARAGLFVLLAVMVTMLEKKDGCSVTFADPLGDGVLSVLALGEQSLVEPIVHAAAQFRESMYKTPTEFLQ